MQKIRMITDSGSDLGQNFHPAVSVLPMSIRFGDREYRDGIDLRSREFYEKLIESDELPATSLVPPGDFEAEYRAAAERGESCLVITISSKVSGTYQSAVLAAEDSGAEVYVVDSCCVATGEQILVLRALELMEKGMSPADIAAALEREKQEVHILAVLDTLEYLKKGGRISPAVALVGAALSIKPVVTVRDGEVAMLGKARGSRNANNYLIKEIESTAGIDFSRPLRLGYTGLGDELLKKYIADSRQLWEGHEDSLQISPIGPTIGTHAGPGAIAVAFFSK